MNRDADSRNGGALRFPLGLKLALVLFVAALIMLAILFGYFGPDAKQSFLERSDILISLSRDALQEMVQKNRSDSKDLLVSLIRHTTEARRRHLMDLPLSLYAGDVQKIRAVIEETDAEKSRRLQENVEILAGEMEARSMIEVSRRLESLTREQSGMGAAFAADIRYAYLILAGAVFLALFLLLGFGLYRTVVYPLRALRQGTRAVARGELDVEVPVRSKDEVGGLSADFASMVCQLRDSRESVRQKNEELEDLNRNLEKEVQGKTRYLEQALDDLRRTQRQLIHAEKMASIGTLAGGVAHEFNNLIGGIRGCAVEALETETDAIRREPLEVILRAALHAGEITDQLLRFSRQRAMQMKSLDVTRTLEEALLLIEPDARQRNVEIERAIESCAPFMADGAALHQVFLNLYTNALQAMPEGGRLLVETDPGPRALVVRVRDSGMGIPEDRIDRIFEPFYTTKDPDADTSARGSGLGLSVSYSIVEAHGGTIEVQSKEGEGTVFIVTLPIPSSPEARDEGSSQ
ncbi:MAG: sensor histidine kinase [Planctomycetota bacterium]|jgi:signal transduction histidine kinase